LVRADEDTPGERGGCTGFRTELKGALCKTELFLNRVSARHILIVGEKAFFYRRNCCQGEASFSGRGNRRVERKGPRGVNELVERGEVTYNDFFRPIYYFDSLEVIVSGERGRTKERSHQKKKGPQGKGKNVRCGGRGRDDKKNAQRGIYLGTGSIVWFPPGVQCPP